MTIRNWFCVSLILVSRWVPCAALRPFVGFVSQWDDVFCNGEGAGGERTHRDTEEGEAEEQAAKVYAFLARESSDFCRARPSVT